MVSVLAHRLDGHERSQPAGPRDDARRRRARRWPARLGGLLAVCGEDIATFVLASVLPTLLGYAGLARAGALPGRTTTSDDEEDLVEELEHRYVRGKLDDAEMERTIETLLAADGDGARSRERVLESELGRSRR